MNPLGNKLDSSSKDTPSALVLDSFHAHSSMAVAGVPCFLRVGAGRSGMGASDDMDTVSAQAGARDGLHM